MTFPLSLPCLLLVTGACVACSGGLLKAPGDSSDAASMDINVPSDGGLDAPKDAENSRDIWPLDAERLVAESAGGGFAAPAPPGSKCTYGAQRYVVSVMTNAFTFEQCAVGATAAEPFHLVKGGRTLTPSELVTVNAAMKALTPPKSVSSCGADKADYHVTVTTPRGETAYVDSFYACQGGGRHYVDNIDNLFDTLTKFAPVR